MKKLGIVGGMGPLAGCEFYRILIEATPASCDQEHFDVLLSGHASIPDRTTAIESKNSAPLVAAIGEDLDLFAGNGIALVAIPCNTSHTFYEELASISRVPIFNMVKNAVVEMKDKFGNRPVTLFSTRGTYSSEVYGKYATAVGLDLRYPTAEDQEEVMRAIYHVKSTQEVRIPWLDPLLDKYTQNDGLVLFACTELSVLDILPQHKNNVADSMTMMALAVVKLMTAADPDFDTMLPRYTGGPTSLDAAADNDVT